MKFETKQLKELRKTIEVWETIERKWTKTLFIYKQKKEALSNQVEALTIKKKENENVLIDLELINLKNSSMFNYEEIRRKTIKVEIYKNQ